MWDHITHICIKLYIYRLPLISFYSNSYDSYLPNTVQTPYEIPRQPLCCFATLSQRHFLGSKYFKILHEKLPRYRRCWNKFWKAGIHTMQDWWLSGQRSNLWNVWPEFKSRPMQLFQIYSMYVNHEQFPDILAVANLELFLCIQLFGSYIPIYISKSPELFGTVYITVLYSMTSDRLSIKTIQQTAVLLYSRCITPYCTVPYCMTPTSSVHT